MWKLLFALFILTIANSARAEEQKTPALWEYGVGVGFIHYEQYPASNQTSEFFLPFPTFQYRGEFLRADDREGARAYLYKQEKWSVEFSGGVLPSLKSQINDARRGMDDLPWMIEFGPQLVGRLREGLEFKFSLFQATATDFRLTELNGQVAEAKLEWKGWLGRFAFLVRGASKEFSQTYFDVPRKDVTADRPLYDSRGGLEKEEITYFQNIKSGRANFYFGLGLSNYEISVNRVSPLHRSDHNAAFFAGLTYTLSESRREAVPEDKTQGVVNRAKQQRLLAP